MVRYAALVETNPRDGIPLFVNVRRLTQLPNNRYSPLNRNEDVAINRPASSGETTFQHVAKFIIRAVKKAVHTYNGEPSRRILETTSGFLQATNRLTGTFLGDEPIPVDPIAVLDGNRMENYISTIQSAEEVAFEDIDWRFSIDANSIMFGGAPKIKRPEYASSRYFVKTWEGHENVNCAAYAINYVIQHPKKVRDQTLIKQAQELQKKLGWALTVSPFEILKSFPATFPEYRVVIINPLVVSLETTAVGRLYESSSGKVVYLIFDPRLAHYAATLHPHRIWGKINSNLILCGPCNIVLDSRRPHTCSNGGKSRTKKFKPTMKCLKCGLELGQYYSSKHDCSVIQCKSCNTKYPRGEHTHRCFVSEIDKEKRFNTDGLDDPEGTDSALMGDGSLPCCFAYDIESRVDIRTEVISRIESFNQKDGLFEKYEGSSEDIVVKEFTARYQQPNWIGVKNIYNNKFYSFTGDHCLSECINFLLAYNSGNNQMWAHNASGYDTRLIYDVACAMMGDLKLEPVERGSKIMILTINKTRRGALIFYDSLNHLKGTIS